MKSENTTIREFVSDLLTEREVDAVRIREIIKSSEKPAVRNALKVGKKRKH